jgi:hypothetical protein
LPGYEEVRLRPDVTVFQDKVHGNA